MKIIKNQLFWWGLFTVVGIMPYQADALNGITITSPATGAIVVPGQAVQVTVQPVGSFTISSILIVTPVGVQLVEQPPFTTTITIPSTAVGSLMIRALGKDSSGTIVSSDITITVQPTALLQTLQVDPSSFYFAALGALKQISVSGTYKDGITRDLTQAEAGATYRSSNAMVVTVSSSGAMRAQADGTAMVTVTNAGISATVKVTVEGQGSLAGDLDRNGVVDCRDLAIINAAFGRHSGQQGFDPQADTNSDDVVDIKDLAFITQKLPSGTHCGPVITISADPTTLWPPNGKMVPVTISGTMTDTSSRPPSSVDASTATYAVTDEYSNIQPSGHITLGVNGSYSFTIQLQASRNGNDTDGRQYTITVRAQDNPTTSLECIDQICARRITALWSQATIENSFLHVRKFLC